MKQNRLISHHNVLTTARSQYTELQFNIFFYVLSKLRKAPVEDDIYDIDIEELSRLSNTSFQTTYIFKACLEMIGKTFQTRSLEVDRGLALFEQVIHLKQKRIVQVQLTRAIRPFLFDLNSHFTQFELYSGIAILSKFGKRIYTLCSSWKDKGKTPIMDILELKDMLGLYDLKNKKDEKFKNNFHKFKLEVLDLSVTQINEKSDLKIRYELHKIGRKYNKIQFFISMQRENVKLPLASKAGQSAPEVKVQPRMYDISQLYYMLVAKAEARMTIHNGTTMGKAFSELIRLGAEQSQIIQIFEKDEEIERFIRWSRPYTMNRTIPEGGIASFWSETDS